MKKLILTGVGLFFAMTLAFAQETEAEQKSKEKVATLNEKLTLNEEQQAAIYPIVLSKHQTKLAVKADTTLSQDDAKQQIDKITAETNTKILDLLNEDQKEMYHKHLEEHKKNREK